MKWKPVFLSVLQIKPLLMHDYTHTHTHTYTVLCAHPAAMKFVTWSLCEIIYHVTGPPTHRYTAARTCISMQFDFYLGASKEHFISWGTNFYNNTQSGYTMETIHFVFFLMMVRIYLWWQYFSIFFTYLILPYVQIWFIAFRYYVFR